MSKIRIITLIENLVYHQGLTAEHGLSLYIETPNKKILFDTGQSGFFMQNARHMGIALENVDVLVLSHGHYDHTGGLYPFLLQNKKATVHIKKGLFDPKYNGTRFIGTQYDEALLEGRITYVNSKTELDKGIFIMPDIHIHNPSDTHFRNLQKKTGENIVEDSFTEELYLAIEKNGKLSVLTGCSHRGITNILTSAQNHFKLPLHLVLGGFHMKGCSADQRKDINNYLEKNNPHSIGVCHCTGVQEYARLISKKNLSVFYNHTGYDLEV